jgi:hypothetical protein
MTAPTVERTTDGPRLQMPFPPQDRGRAGLQRRCALESSEPPDYRLSALGQNTSKNPIVPGIWIDSGIAAGPALGTPRPAREAVRCVNAGVCCDVRRGCAPCPSLRCVLATQSGGWPAEAARRVLLRPNSNYAGQAQTVQIVLLAASSFRPLIAIAGDCSNGVVLGQHERRRRRAFRPEKHAPCSQEAPSSPPSRQTSQPIVFAAVSNASLA